MPAKINRSDRYLASLDLIEEYIFEASGYSIKALEIFHKYLAETFLFISLNPTTPAINFRTMNRSWPLAHGRYRIFFEFRGGEINLIEIIDNRRENQLLNISDFDEE